MRRSDIMVRRAVVLVLAPACLTLFSVDRAGASTPRARERASALFDEAKASMAKGDYSSACSKLVESESLDEQIGTMMNLAYCDEHLGRTATAWWLWTRAADAADARGQAARATFARGRAAELEPALLRVSVHVAIQATSQPVTVTLDGTPLNDLGVATPVDPGEHELQAEGVGLRAWSMRFAATPGEVSALLVPSLEPASVAEPRAIEPADGAPAPPARGATGATGEGPRGSLLWPAAWAVGGLAALGVGAAFGIAALSNERASNDNRNCVSNACNATGAGDRWRARHDAEIADASFAVGAGALVTAAVWWVASSRSPPVRPMVEAVLSRDSGSIALSGAW